MYDVCAAVYLMMRCVSYHVPTSPPPVHKCPSCLSGFNAMTREKTKRKTFYKIIFYRSTEIFVWNHFFFFNKQMKWRSTVTGLFPDVNKCYLYTTYIYICIHVYILYVRNVQDNSFMLQQFHHINIVRVWKKNVRFNNNFFDLEKSIQLR